MHKQLIVVAGLLALSLGPPGMNSNATAQVYTIPWYTLDGGGGRSTGGTLGLSGTIGQTDASPLLSGGNYRMQGGFWLGIARPSVKVAPDSFVVTRGTYVSGGIAELSLSDNQDLSIRRNTADIQSRTQFEVKSTSPYSRPNAFEIRLEGSVFARSPVDQSLELFDYVTASWELVDLRQASRFTDATVTISATGDLSRFVQPGTRCIEARIQYRSRNPRQNFASNTDQVQWTIQ